MLSAFATIVGDAIASHANEAAAAVIAPGARRGRRTSVAEHRHALEHPHRADAAEDGDRRGGDDQVALVAGEAGLGHHRHEREPGEPPSAASASVGALARGGGRHATAAHADGDQRAELDRRDVTSAKRSTSSIAGCSANAALPGLGAFAREPARNGSPDPHHSGRNQSAGTSAAKHHHPQPQARLANQSQSP